MTRWLAGGMVLAAMTGAATAGDVEYQVGGESFEGYFAAADDPAGLVLIIHDWNGLDDYERQRADMIAELGYDAFAIDVFGAGNRPETTEARIEATRAVLGDRDRLRALVLAGLGVAREQSEADRAVIIGYCFGGTVALALARTGEAEDVAGYASFHGNFPDGPDWPEDAPPILVMHGGIDRNPSMQDLAGFVEEAEAAGLTYDVEIYAGADHAFTVFGGDRYQERADARSWDAFQRFLTEVLEESPS
jgi:dienelactone hydrolase